MSGRTPTAAAMRCERCATPFDQPRLTIRVCCAAQLLGLSPRTLIGWCASGRFPKAKTLNPPTLIPTVAFHAWCQEHGIAIPQPLGRLFAAADKPVETITTTVTTKAVA